MQFACYSSLLPILKELDPQEEEREISYSLGSSSPSTPPAATDLKKMGRSERLYANCMDGEEGELAGRRA